MNNINKNNIIVALATPYGKSAVAIVRVSGKGCIEFVNGFLSRRVSIGKMKLTTFKTDKFTEKLLAVGFIAPKSYTGEDTVELFPHGSMTICDGIIKTLVDNGARIAEKGEFTKRAFLNGKVDLMQCEALADIIDAQTTEQLVYGNKRYDGGFKSLGEVEKSLNNALSTIEAVLHYGDELEENETDTALLDDVYTALDVIITKLEDETKKFVGGKTVNEGFKIALVGAPNVGKSTLLNALTESDRAIVTPIAGTTRDTVDGRYAYRDREFTVIDTAGIKDSTDDVVERIGIERAKKTAESADAIVYVTTRNDEKVDIDGGSKIRISVKNKCDEAIDVSADYAAAERDGFMEISAKLGKNIVALKEKLYDLCPKDCGGICNHRQFGCVTRCLESCRAAAAECSTAGGLEIVAALLYDAYSAIEELYGEKADEKVIDSVFERFCVGK